MGRGLAVGLALGLAAGCSGPSPRTPPDTVPSTSLTAHEFVRLARQTDPVARKQFERDYVNQTIEVSGQVDFLGPVGAGQAVVALRVADAPVALMCYTEDKQPWAVVVPGQTVRLRGKVSGLPTPRLDNAMIVAPTAFAAPQLTANGLAAEVAADFDKARQVYDQKWIRLEGAVADALPVGAGLELRLEGQDAAKVVCRIRPAAKQPFAGAQPGERLVLVGQVEFDQDKRSFAIRDALRIVEVAPK